MARALAATGVEPGDRVALWAPNSARWIAASFGVYAAGAVLVPFNTRYRGEEAGHILRTSGARLLLTVTDFLDTDYVELLDGVAGLDALEERIVLSGVTPRRRHELGRLPAREARTSRLRTSRPASRRSSRTIAATSSSRPAPPGHPRGRCSATARASARTSSGASWSTCAAATATCRCTRSSTPPASSPACWRACSAAPRSTRRARSTSRPCWRLVAEERITMLPGPPTVFQTILNHPDLGLVRPLQPALVGDRCGRRPRRGDPADARDPADPDRRHRIRHDRDDRHDQHVPARRSARGDRPHRRPPAARRRGAGGRRRRRRRGRRRAGRAASSAAST